MGHRRTLPKLPGRPFLLTALILLLLFPSKALSKREHLVHFPNTAYELNIYKIYGKRPGKTLMLIGGIQGNEPGGFLSADLYADMSLAKGNLIVVPRANFYSIILNQRGAHGDMNRKFTSKNNHDSMEDKIVAILKELISQSDYLLNLHDGTGYYYPKYINKWRNPMRFGQSIIADGETYQVPGTNRVINLKEMAEEVLREVNPHIKNELYQFHFMNTKTGEKNSPHSEQQRSATYYALTEHHIPAFGVETSKFLPSIDLKVRYHNLVINAFKKLFDIVPESPRFVLDPPVLKYLVVSLNGQRPIVVNTKTALNLQAGDTMKVTHIESNYERGLSIDILGYGGLNDFRKDFVIFRNTTLIVRKDNHRFGEIPIKITKKRIKNERIKTAGPRKLKGFVIETRGHRLLLSNRETLHLVKGDKMKIVDIIPSFSRKERVEVNFKGFVGDWKNNTGEDRGYLIDTGGALLKRFSLKKDGRSYEIIVKKAGKKIGRLIVSLSPPKMNYLVLRVNGHKPLFLRSEDRIALSSQDEIRLEEIQTNLHSKNGVHLNINGHKMRPGEVRLLKELCGKAGRSTHQASIKKGSLLLGRLFINTD